MTMGSEGLASNLRAVAEGESQAKRSATSALIRACSLEAKEIPAERAQTHGVCGRHGGTEKRLTWGDLEARGRHCAAELRGTAFGVFNLVSGGALLLASVIAGVLWSAVGASATFLAGAAFAAVTAIGVLAYRTTTHATE
jgi:hypothetical protein